MERVQPPSHGGREPEEQAVPAERDPARLATLIAEARGTTLSGEALGVAGEINALLVAMRAPGNESAEAKAVLAALDLGSLEGLVDAKGRSCKAEAVETLLACGFPHALQVRPEELEHRDQAVKTRGGRDTTIAGVLIVGLLIAVLTYLGDLKTALATTVFGTLLIAFLYGMVAGGIAKKDKSKF